MAMSCSDRSCFHWVWLAAMLLQPQGSVPAAGFALAPGLDLSACFASRQTTGLCLAAPSSSATAGRRSGALATPLNAERDTAPWLRTRARELAMRPGAEHNPALQREIKVLDARAKQLELGLEGLFALYKPTNISSFAAVFKIRAALQSIFRTEHPTIALKHGQLKVGHGGTLDPMASGVLVIGVGWRVTPIMSRYTTGSKAYDAIVTLGHETDSCDAEGKRTAAREWGHVTHQLIREACDALTGEIMQVPPLYSALNVNGTRAYQLARQDENLELSARPVSVHSIEILQDFAETAPDIHLRVECGGGTYVRSLARDLGRRLSSAAHLTALERIKQGEFGLGDCVSLESVDHQPEAILLAMRRNAVTLDSILHSRQSDKMQRAASHAEVPQRCDFCAEVFPSKNALFRHLRGTGECAKLLARQESDVNVGI